MTRAAFRLCAAGVLCWSLASPIAAQESKFASDVRRERENIASSCDSLKGIGNCVYTLVSSYPFHVALGSLAPGSGFAFGLAVSERHTPNESWRITWSGDVVATPSGAYRAGAYAKFIHTPGLGIVVRRPGDPPVAPRRLKLDTWVIDVFGQTSSLKDISYYGEGPDSQKDDRSLFGERQTIVGGSVILPMSGASWIGALRPALIGGVTTRVVDIRPGDSPDAPSIFDRYSDADTPGLTRQDAFVEFREGVRFRPSLPGGWLRFNYLASAQQFNTSEDSQSSFSRWTLDLQHEIPLYRGVTSSGPPADFNGPNECSTSVDSLACPPLQRSRNRTGTVGIRVLLSRSSTASDNQVPFYFQPTLGGSDLNGERKLASFDDYRFRAPNVLLFQESVEHSLWGPVGVFVMAEQGRVALRGEDLGFDGLRTTTTLGLTLRAGAFPMITLSYSWGAEGNHLVGMMNGSLLGGSARPSLY